MERINKAIEGIAEKDRTMRMLNKFMTQVGEKWTAVDMLKRVILGRTREVTKEERGKIWAGESGMKKGLQQRYESAQGPHRAELANLLNSIDKELGREFSISSCRIIESHSKVVFSDGQVRQPYETHCFQDVMATGKAEEVPWEDLFKYRAIGGESVFSTQTLPMERVVNPYNGTTDTEKVKQVVNTDPKSQKDTSIYPQESKFEDSGKTYETKAWTLDNLPGFIIVALGHRFQGTWIPDKAHLLIAGLANKK